MADNKEDKKDSNIFSKLLEAGEAILDAQIAKARNSVTIDNKSENSESDFIFGKAVTQDRTYSIGSQGYQEKIGSITYDHLKWMAIKSSVVSAIIKTRQNRVAAFSKISKDSNKLGFKISLKNEEEALDELRKELSSGKQESKSTEESRSTDLMSEISKADENLDDAVTAPLDPEVVSSLDQKDGDVDGDGDKEDDFDSLSPKVQERKLQDLLKEKTKKKVRSIQEFIINCGDLNDRPFETKKWNFDTYLRAIVWDTLIYDQISTELVPKEAEILKAKLNIHHFYPVDGSTVRYSSPALKDMKNNQMMSGYDILYPEEQLKQLEEKDALTLDDERLKNNEYKWVQVIRGRIERAFTEDELAVGFRNPVTDILSNGYPISELELLIALVGSHLQTEFYNRSYFQQGFSAKGILHVKANLNRAKLEELKRHWSHLVSGNRNSFQTPIMSGMEEIQWIPLTQNHNEMEFNLWLNYLIKMICAIYQIDPAEIGYGIKDEGRSGSGMSGDNTSEKLENSKDKGFVPLMTFLQSYINKSIVDKLDPDYQFEWVGLDTTGEKDNLELREREAKFVKTVNEIREEYGLSPIEGADDLILDPVYFQWFAQFHPDGQAKLEQDQQNAMMQQQQGQEDPNADQGPEVSEQDYKVQEAQKESDHQRQEEAKDSDLRRQKELESHKAKLSKATTIEYYKSEE